MYELILTNGETERFSALGELLNRMNRRFADKTKNLQGKADNLEVWTSTGKSYPIEQRVNHLGIRMTPDDGHVEEIMTQMFNEVMPYAYGENGTIKAPWQMTSDQWGAINAIGSVAYGVIPCLSDEHRQQTCLNREGQRCSVMEYVASEFNARFGYGHNGPLYDGHQTNSRHEVHVAYALARGDNVTEDVLAEYNNAEWLGGLLDLHWFKTLLQKPFLRGRISAEKLSKLVSLLKSNRNEPIEITEENASFLIGLMNSLPTDATYADCDNILFERGVLRVLPLHVPEKAPDIGVPVNAFAAELRQMQVKNRMKNQLAYIDEQMAKGHMTLREKQFQLNQVNDIPNWERHGWANKIARAIEDKNLAYLLEILDRPENDTTKKAVEKFYPGKLRNVTAVKRRRGVFALVGHVTDEQYAAADAAYKAKEKTLLETKAAEEELKRNETRVEDAKAIAAQLKIRVNGTVMNGAEFVEKIIREGFDQIDTRKRGAVPSYIIRNVKTDSSYKLQRKNGTLDYAQALLEKEAETA